jgi:hypothetical protein
MMQWLYANVEFSAAALATELSVSRWADDDQFGFTGDHVWLAGTYPAPQAPKERVSLVDVYCCMGTSSPNKYSMPDTQQ